MQQKSTDGKVRVLYVVRGVAGRVPQGVCVGLRIGSVKGKGKKKEQSRAPLPRRIVSCDDEWSILTRWACQGSSRVISDGEVVYLPIEVEQRILRVGWYECGNDARVG